MKTVLHVSYVDFCISVGFEYIIEKQITTTKDATVTNITKAIRYPYAGVVLTGYLFVWLLTIQFHVLSDIFYR